jgi:hypothetical protein
MDDIEIGIEDLAIDEIRELLLDAGAEISLEQAEQLARFITQSGSIERGLARVPADPGPFEQKATKETKVGRRTSPLRLSLFVAFLSFCFNSLGSNVRSQSPPVSYASRIFDSAFSAARALSTPPMASARRLACTRSA